MEDFEDATFKSTIKKLILKTSVCDVPVTSSERCLSSILFLLVSELFKMFVVKER